MRQHKIAIVGAGLVGGSAALFAACERRLPRDLALYRTALADVAWIRLGSIWSGRPRDGAE